MMAIAATLLVLLATACLWLARDAVSSADGALRRARTAHPRSCTDWVMSGRCTCPRQCGSGLDRMREAGL